MWKETKDIQDPQKTQETHEPEGNDKDCPHHLHISPNYVQHMVKSLLDRETNIWSQFDGSNERRRCEHSFLGVYLCLSLFKLQIILGKITRKFYDLPRINP